MGHWRTDLEQRAPVKELAALEKQRHADLLRDSKYLLEKDRLTSRLEAEYDRTPTVVAEFFRKFRFPTARKLIGIRTFLQTLQDNKLRATLERYVVFANRFRVALSTRATLGHFEWRETLPLGPKFHARINNGQFVPVQDGVGDEMDGTLFESDTIAVPSPLQKLIDSGKAKYVHIEDNDGSSILSRLEALAYFAEGITFVSHDAEQPYLLCMLGEKVTSQQLREASKAVTAFFQSYYGRGKAGRPIDLDKMRRANRLLAQKGSMKEKAVELAGKVTNVPSQQSYLSRHQKRLKE